METEQKVMFTGLVDSSVHKTISELQAYRLRNQNDSLAVCFDVDET